MALSLALSTVGLSPAVHARGARAAPVEGQMSKPNVVTPLLPSNHAAARANSKVSLPGYNATDLYSGFFTIDETTGSNTYFIYSTPVSGRATFASVDRHLASL